METAIKIISLLLIAAAVLVTLAQILHFIIDRLNGFRRKPAGRPERPASDEPSGGMRIKGGKLQINSVSYNLKRFMHGPNPDALAAFNSELSRMLLRRAPLAADSGEASLRVRLESVSRPRRAPMRKLVAAVSIMAALIILLYYLADVLAPDRMQSAIKAAIIVVSIVPVLARVRAGLAHMASRWSCTEGALVLGGIMPDRTVHLREVSALRFMPGRDGFTMVLDLHDGGADRMQIQSANMDALLPIYDCIVRHRPELKYSPALKA